MKPPITLAIASAMAIGLMTVSPASAATAERAIQRVSYADLNLENEAGAEAMLRRIQNAARQVCGDRFGRRDLRERAQIRSCTREAVEDGVADVNRSALTALYWARVPRVSIASD